MAGLNESVREGKSEEDSCLDEVEVCDRDKLEEMSDKERISDSEHSHHEEEDVVVEKSSSDVPSATATSSAVRRPRPMKSRVGEKKIKLRTSKDVYDRLRWDNVTITREMDEGAKKDGGNEEPGFDVDVEEVYIGYLDRFLGMCEIPFLDFQPGEEGDIPYHRIYYFRTGGAPLDPFVGKNGEVKVRDDNLPPTSVFLWDRESRTDLIFHSGDSHPSMLKRKIQKKKVPGEETAVVGPVS